MTSHDSSRTADPLVGRTLGDCTIQDCLARARRCAVYQARQRPMNREVAVKVLSPALSSDPAAVERFVHEGEAAAAAWDDALVEVHSVGESDGLHYIVMGLVDGEELSSQLLRDGPLRAARAVPLMMQIGAALAAVHRAGVIHCDLQPANILVTDDGKAKLGGFSQAKFAGAPPPVRREDDPTDLPLYFPPEAARGKPLDVRSDIYLFGATLYHLLSGFPPFEAASPEALALMHLREPAPPLQREAPGTPPELCDLVHKLLQKDPAERPETVQDVLDALDRIELDTAGQVKAAGLFRKRKLRPPRRKRLIAGLAVAILGVTLLGLATGVFRPEPPQPPDPLATALDAPPPGPTPGPVEPPSPWQPPTPTHPPWEAALADTGRAVAQLVGSQAFGRALAQYDALEAEHPEPELRVRTGSMREAVLTQAQTAYAALEARATALEATGDFDEARALLRHVVDHYGLDGLTTAATERLAALGRVEKATRDQWAEERRAAAERDERLRLERLSALRKEALHGMRQSLRALDIAAARKHVAGLAPGDATLEQALQDIARVAAVKRKLIALVNAPQPRLRTASIGLPGMGGELKKADDRGLEVHRAHGRPETYSWEQLGAAPLLKLAQRATDAKSGEDLLTCGLLASLLGLTNKSGGLFKAATRLGADATPYLAPLVRDDLAAVERLVGEGQFELAAARLKQLEATHRGAPWLAAVRDRVDGARGAVERGMGDAKAEKVYREAVALFEQKRFFELKPFVTRLKDEFPSSQAVTDTKRPVPFARLAQAVDGLGIRLTVGRRFSDVRTLAEAIEQAKPHSLIELTDTTPYMEAVTIPARLRGLVIRGKADILPVITSVGAQTQTKVLLTIEASDVTVERVILLHGDPTRPQIGRTALVAKAGRIRLRDVIVSVALPSGARQGRDGASVRAEPGAPLVAERCAFVGATLTASACTAADSLWVHGPALATGGSFEAANCLFLDGARLEPPATLVQCTALYDITIGPASRLRDCLLSGVRADSPNVQIDYCNVFGKTGIRGRAKPGLNFATDPPQFNASQKLDFRLTRGPRRSASDGKERGYRPDAAMNKLRQTLLKLRDKGRVHFPITHWRP